MSADPRADCGAIDTAGIHAKFNLIPNGACGSSSVPALAQAPAAAARALAPTFETASRVRLAFAASCPEADLFRSLPGALIPIGP